MNTIEINVEITKKGYFAMWENGGGYTHTGHSQIITNFDGTMPHALFVKTGGHLACSDHALVIVNIGMKIILTSRHNDDISIKILRIKEFKTIDAHTAIAICEVKNKFDNGEWDFDLDPNMLDAINASINKSKDYHCRSTYWIKK